MMPVDVFRYCCPKCKADNLTVKIIAWASFNQDSSDGDFSGLEVDSEELEWDESSVMKCMECDRLAPVGDFENPDWNPQ